MLWSGPPLVEELQFQLKSKGENITMKLKPVTLQKEEAKEALARARLPRWPTITIEMICNVNWAMTTAAIGAAKKMIRLSSSVYDPSGRSLHISFSTLSTGSRKLSLMLISSSAMTNANKERERERERLRERDLC